MPTTASNQGTKKRGPRHRGPQLLGCLPHPIGAVVPFVVVSRPAPPVASQQALTALPSHCLVEKGVLPHSLFTGFYSEHTPPLWRLKHAGDARAPVTKPAASEVPALSMHIAMRVSWLRGDVTLRAQGRTCAGQGAAVSHNQETVDFFGKNVEAPE